MLTTSVKTIAQVAGKIVNIPIALNKAYNDLIKARVEGVKRIMGPWEKFNQASSKLAKNIGLSAQAMGEFRDRAVSAASDLRLGEKYGIKTEDLIESAGSITKGTGRKVGISNDSFENLAAMHSVLGKADAEAFITRLDTMGVSLNDAAKISGKMFSKAAKSGLDFGKYSKNFLENIKKAQTYNFRDGVKGVETMAKRATELKFSIEEAAKFSDKVNNLEGALQAGAQLQALGGSFAQFSNPLEMLNESYTSMEDTYERMVNMFGTHGKFDASKGEVAVNGMDRKRIKVASEAMGVSFDEMMEGIHAKGRRDEIGRQMEGRYDLSDEMKELIMNTGTFKDGQAGIVDQNGEFKRLSEITQADQARLIELNRTESDDVKDIAMNVRTLTDIISGSDATFEAKRANDKRTRRYAEGKTRDSHKYDFSKTYRKRVNRDFRSAQSERDILTLEGYSGYFNVLGGPKGAEGGIAGNIGKLDGASHAQGGVQTIVGKDRRPLELEGGEYVINKESTKEYLPVLEYINKQEPKKMSDGGTVSGNVSNYSYETIKNEFSKLTNSSNVSNSNISRPVAPDVSRMSPAPVVPEVTVNPVDGGSSSGHVKMDPLNINFSGSIKIEGKNGDSVDITKALLEDRMFIRNITDEINRQISENRYGKPTYK